MSLFPACKLGKCVVGAMEDIETDVALLSKIKTNNYWVFKIIV